MLFSLALAGIVIHNVTAYACCVEGKDLAATLKVLRAELQSTYNEQKQHLARYNTLTQMQHKQMISLMQRSDQIGLMLYSQKQDFTFDMTYACHEATQLYNEFNKRSVPIKDIGSHQYGAKSLQCTD